MEMDTLEVNKFFYFVAKLQIYTLIYPIKSTIIKNLTNIEQLK